jgi:hypothetical protein
LIEPRVYRAAFVPAVLAAVLAAFSLQSRPAPLPQGLAADVLFDGRLAAAGADRIVTAAPDRRPGSDGDRRTAATVRRTFLSRGFRVETDRFQHSDRNLANIVARRAGRTRRQIVVLAPRDAHGVPDATGSAGDTAALLELSRVFAGRPSRKTLVLASVDGSTLGEVGTGRLADDLGDGGPVDGVIALSDLGAPAGHHGSLIVPWSTDSHRAGIGLERTVADSIRQELGEPGAGAGVLGQLARIGVPVGVGPQGVLLERGLDAVRISGSGELPPTGSTATSRVDRDRLGGLGRAALRTLSALDAGAPPGHGPGTYISVVSQVMPGWALAVLALALLLPALVAAVDAFARARRQREPVGRWLWWLAAAVAPFLAALVLARLLALVDLTPDPPPAAVAPSYFPLDAPALVVLGLLTATTALAWLGTHRLSARGRPALADGGARGAACATALVLTVGAVLLWVVNPFAALIVAPAVHLWMLATLVDPPPVLRARIAMVAVGAAPIALVGLYYLLRLSMNPLEGVWYLLMLLIGGQVGVVTAVLATLFAGLFCAVVAIVAQRGEPEADAAPTVRGPASYAGPGSLGGTDSALRR